ncbi:MAG: DHHC palmitoyltransferase-domain-containing protein [Piptocephalis tieghemiana]|nr:MAG: DHHC palmitoyltransferase-domain-containing protein [Piptocephalis tieghemiana]
MDIYRLLDAAVVGLVCLLIAFIQFTSQYYVLIPAYGGFESRETWIKLLPFNVLAGFIWWHYYLACSTSPGRVPKEWPPENAVIIERKKSGRIQMRYCRTCRSHKPPRAHHCSSCGRCVLRMDHHCPWLNNCVGHGNHGHFFRFLLSVVLGCGYIGILLCLYLWHLYQTNQSYYDPETYIRPPELHQVILLALTMISNAVVFMMVGGLFTYQIYITAYGTSTIESWEMEKIRRMIQQGRIPDSEFPYDLGPLANFRSVLGPSWTSWILPCKPLGDGLSFPISMVQQGKSPR